MKAEERKRLYREMVHLGAVAKRQELVNALAAFDALYPIAPVAPIAPVRRARQSKTSAPVQAQSRPAWSAKQRKAVSARMKKYWAEKRKASA